MLNCKRKQHSIAHACIFTFQCAFCADDNDDVVQNLCRPWKIRFKWNETLTTHIDHLPMAILFIDSTKTRIKIKLNEMKR